ncbi:MAG: anti-sigma factor, partial [Marinobacter sp.]
KDYELWIVPESGNPLSLGVVPVGGVYQVTLTDEARQALSSSRTLAISLEPAGGSPTGAPTGPILHVTKLYEL